MILLDTNALVWLRSDPARLSKIATEFIRASGKQDAIAISAITLYEIAWLAERGRIRFYGPPLSILEEVTAGLSVRPLTAQVAAVAAGFPETYPRDPADRIIGATAIVAGIPLVTADEGIRRSGIVKTVW